MLVNSCCNFVISALMLACVQGIIKTNNSARSYRGIYPGCNEPSCVRHAQAFRYANHLSVQTCPNKNYWEKTLPELAIEPPEKLQIKPNRIKKSCFSMMCTETLLQPETLATATPSSGDKAPFRPPAVPLVTHDPYFSVWSAADCLTDEFTKHWTGATQGMCGLVRIDGVAYRYAGPEAVGAPALTQTGLDIAPTRTVYHFAGAGIALTLSFLSPLLPHDLDSVSRPITYLTWTAVSTDGKPHDVSLYYDAAAEWAVNTADQPVNWSRSRAGDLSVLRMGSQQQPVLEKAGDNLRIDWGYFYLAAPDTQGNENSNNSKNNGGKSAGIPLGGTRSVLAGAVAVRQKFVEDGTIPEADDTRMPRAANDEWIVGAFTFALGAVGNQPVSRHLILAYDDGYSIEYFHQKLRPYWRRNGLEADGLLREAEHDYAAIDKKCHAFDAEITADLTRIGGADYAQIAALSFRQCLAAHKLVADKDGSPLYFSKENFSNGCIDTVDVTYPSSPFFLLFNPYLLKAQLTPILDYASSDRWKHAYAPHDLGTYPKANGQVYGGGEESDRDQMPVEECGNMLLMIAALTKADGNADYALKHWDLLTKWADYLHENGFNPDNQLCTDDFAGHMAHNTNLSLKAITALGGFAQVCEAAGKHDVAQTYRQSAEQMAAQWVTMAQDGDHYRLAFDSPGSWSQKYNLVWDKLLGMKLFSPEVARTEVASYKNRLNRYGLPLDNRAAYTKLDWTVWSATLADNEADFQTLVAPLTVFVNESPSRVPLTDWYGTVDGKMVGFQARSVVGGVYIPLLGDAALWKKWRSRAK